MPVRLKKAMLFLREKRWFPLRKAPEKCAGGTKYERLEEFGPCEVGLQISFKNRSKISA
jgi:hypothetical protein